MEGVLHKDFDLITALNEKIVLLRHEVFQKKIAIQILEMENRVITEDMGNQIKDNNEKIEVNKHLYNNAVSLMAEYNNKMNEFNNKIKYKFKVFGFVIAIFRRSIL